MKQVSNTRYRRALAGIYLKSGPARASCSWLLRPWLSLFSSSLWSSLPGYPIKQSVNLLRKISNIGDWYRQLRSLEQLVVYDGEAGRIWRAELPRDEIVGRLDYRCRYVRSNLMPEITGAIAFGAGGWLIGVAVWWFLIPVIVIDLIFAAMFMPVAVIGWLVGSILAPKPVWAVRRNADLLEPILNMAAHSNQGVDVLTSSFLYEAIQMRDEQDFVRGGDSNWQKVATAGVVGLFGCMIIALFFFGAVFATGAQ